MSENRMLSSQFMNIAATNAHTCLWVKIGNNNYAELRNNDACLYSGTSE